MSYKVRNSTWKNSRGSCPAYSRCDCLKSTGTPLVFVPSYNGLTEWSTQGQNMTQHTFALRSLTGPHISRPGQLSVFVWTRSDGQTGARACPAGYTPGGGGGGGGHRMTLSWCNGRLLLTSNPSAKKVVWCWSTPQKNFHDKVVCPMSRMYHSLN